MSGSAIISIGIIGCGEVSQVVHIPTITHMSDLFRIVYLCDVSPGALAHCAAKINYPVKTTTDARELTASESVDIVFIVNSDEFHAPHAVLALENNKYVFIEKPMALTLRDADIIIDAEKRSKGRVMVGYMRRYAHSYLDLIKEIGGMDKILYARVRDIIGPNSYFVAQSATFPKQFTDFAQKDVEDRNSRAAELIHQALQVECGVPVTEQTTRMYRLLCGLGSHDLSAMREALGMPVKVIGASLERPFWNVLFQFPGFTVSYESAIDNIPRFDAHIEVHSMNKSVRIQYDTPYVKGLPITIHTRENVDGTYIEKTIRRTYEDAYTAEMRELHKWYTQGTPVKTTPEDAKKDTEIFYMIMRAGFSSNS